MADEKRTLDDLKDMVKGAADQAEAATMHLPSRRRRRRKSP